VGDGGAAATTEGVALGGASVVKNSAATQPSRPCPSRTLCQSRSPERSCSPSDRSGVPSGRVPIGAPPGACRNVSPWPAVPVT
jgi:hypothetical protein